MIALKYHNHMPLNQCTPRSYYIEVGEVDLLLRGELRRLSGMSTHPDIIRGLPITPAYSEQNGSLGKERQHTVFQYGI